MSTSLKKWPKKNFFPKFIFFFEKKTLKSTKQKQKRENKQREQAYLAEF